MNINKARLISELLCNSGWLDDPDELIQDCLDNGTEDEARQVVTTVTELIEEVNSVLPPDEQIQQLLSLNDILDSLL